MTAVLVPQLSLSMEEAKVSRWLVEDGEAVAAGQLVVEVETDKATVEIEAPGSGVLRIIAAEGAVVAVDGVLAELEPALASRADEERDDRAVTAPAAAVGGRRSAVDAPRRGSGPIASPAARRIARERGVELADVRGTGPGGRIVARDLGATPAGNGSAAPVTDDRLRAAVVANITASWQQIPHVHIGGELAADGVIDARASAGAAVTVTDVLVVALARALGEVPELNALLRPVAPVLRDADSLALVDVARERSRLVEAARQGSLDGHELTGGTCTLSNLGAHPVDFFAPVVSGPQVAMVATGRVADRPVALDGLVGVRPRMWVNVAIDHRAADGEAGGRLLAALERQIALLPGGQA
jgi:pyruvate dehydrogenase E2 component (dihydrolipoamide acetyltransferase)